MVSGGSCCWRMGSGIVVGRWGLDRLVQGGRWVGEWVGGYSTVGLRAVGGVESCGVLMMGSFEGEYA